MKRVLVTVVVLLVGCSEPSPPAPIPPPMAEAVPKPPVSAEALVWQPGHWDCQEHHHHRRTLDCRGRH